MTTKKRFKDFGQGVENNAAPISFKLKGEEFHAVAEIPGGALIDLVKNSASEDAATSIGVVTEFFSAVLTEESYERFEKLIHDKKRIVTTETLGEITSWLMEEYTNRPEAPSEDS